MRRAARRRFAAAGIAGLLLAPAFAQAREATEIVVNYAYGTPQRFTLEGRVIERHGGRPAGERDTWLTNLWRTLRALLTEDRGRVALRLSFATRDWTVRSDDEGYFALSAETPPQARAGWNPLQAETADGTARTDTELLIVPGDNTLGVISDFDDTVIVSDVPDRSRLAAHSLLENYLQRRPVEGMATLYRVILARNPLPAAAPVFYLTATPRQLQPAVAAFLDRNQFPRGPIIAKKVTDGAGRDPLLDPERYKLDRIERILADLPGVRFALVGDDGERDPETYDAVRTRHPERIEAIYIRRVGARPDRATYPGQAPPPLPDAYGPR